LKEVGEELKVVRLVLEAVLLTVDLLVEVEEEVVDVNALEFVLNFLAQQLRFHILLHEGLLIKAHVHDGVGVLILELFKGLLLTHPLQLVDELRSGDLSVFVILTCARREIFLYIPYWLVLKLIFLISEFEFNDRALRTLLVPLFFLALFTTIQFLLSSKAKHLHISLIQNVLTICRSLEGEPRGIV